MTPFEFHQAADRIAPPRLAQWAHHVAAAALARGLHPLYILAILDRESNGKAADILGFDGGGRGLMQIDVRYHRSFCEASFLGRELWSDPAFNVLAGATLLRDLLDTFAGDLWSAAAAYNCGPSKVHKALKGIGPGATEEMRISAVDKGTTLKNYASDVRRRMEKFTAAYAALRKDSGNA